VLLPVPVALMPDVSALARQGDVVAFGVGHVPKTIKDLADRETEVFLLTTATGFECKNHAHAEFILGFTEYSGVLLDVLPAESGQYPRGRKAKRPESARTDTSSKNFLEVALIKKLEKPIPMTGFLTNSGAPWSRVPEQLVRTTLA